MKLFNFFEHLFEINCPDIHYNFRFPIGSHVVGAFIMPCGNCFFCVKVGLLRHNIIIFFTDVSKHISA